MWMWIIAIAIEVRRHILCALIAWSTFDITLNNSDGFELDFVSWRAVVVDIVIIIVPQSQQF